MATRKIRIHDEMEITVKGNICSEHTKKVARLFPLAFFSSVGDAAKAACVHPTEMSKHLHGRRETVHGQKYCFVSELYKYYDELAESTSELYNNSQKWKEHEAAEEAVRKEQEAALKAEEDARLAEEKRLAEIEKAKKKWERRKKIRQRKEEEVAQAKAREAKAYDEYISLVGNGNENEEVVA